MDLDKVIFTQKKIHELEEAIRYLPEFIFKSKGGKNPEITAEYNSKYRQVNLFLKKYTEIDLPITSTHVKFKKGEISFIYLGRSYTIFIPK